MSPPRNVGARRYEILHDGESYSATGRGGADAVENFAEAYYAGDCQCPEGPVQAREVGTEAWSTYEVTAESVVVFAVKLRGDAPSGEGRVEGREAGGE